MSRVQTPSIDFCGPMIRAIRSGMKTQTRRVIDYCSTADTFRLIDGRIWRALDPQQYDPHTKQTIYGGECRLEDDALFYAPIVIGRGPGGDGNPATCPYGVPGDELWVRETWRPVGQTVVQYWADGHSGLEKRGGDAQWRAAMNMPRRVSRITLELTGVRIERLQDISGEDLSAEGFPPDDSPPRDGTRLTLHGRRMCFAEFWDRLCGPNPWETWDANPWVWVLGFQRKGGAS